MRRIVPLLVILVALAFSISAFAQVIPVQYAYRAYGYPHSQVYITPPYYSSPYYAYPPYSYSYAPYGYYPYDYYPYYSRPGLSFSFGVGGPFFIGGSYWGHGHGGWHGGRGGWHRGHGHGGHHH